VSSIVIFGATGAVGLSVAAALRRERIPYRVVGRSRAALEAAFARDPLAELVLWDPADAASVRRAAAGAEVALDLVGGDYHRWRALPTTTRAIVEGAAAAGLRRVVLAGTVYAYGRPRTARVDESHPREPDTEKGRLRKEQEDVVLDAHARGRVEGVVLRMADFYGPGVEKSLLARAFRAALRGARAPMLAPVDTPHEFLFVPDAGPVFVALSRAPGAAGQALNLGGPGVTSQRALAALAFAEMGHRLRVLEVGPALRALGGLVDPVLRELGEMSYLHTTPVLLDDARLGALLGPIAKTSYEEGVRRSMAALREAS
jgi:nucleoside-diphosphate-sugar epimerase